MLHKVFGTVGIPLPENYSDKLRQLQKSSAVAGVKRANSNKSFFSMVSRTNMSSKKSFISETKSNGVSEASDDDYEDDESGAIKKINPVMDSLK